MAKAPGTIRRRGAGWNVIIRVDGERHEYGPRKEALLRHGSRSAVEEWVWQEYRRLVEQAKRAADEAAGVVNVSTLIERFEAQELPGLAIGTQKSYSDSFGVFRVFFVDRLGDPRADDVRRADVKAFLAWRRTYRVGREGGVSAHTVAKDLRVLKRLMNFAVEMDYIIANPCARVRAPKPDQRDTPILSDDQYEALLSECEHDPMLHLYVLVLGETGVRAFSEALQLRWEDADLSSGFLRVRSAPGRRTKSGKSRSVPMTARLRSALRQHAATYRLALYDGKRSPFLFHHTRTHRAVVAGARVRSFSTALSSAIKRAKLPVGFRPHDLRHRRVTTWLANGANPVHVKEAVGHASLATTMGYTHLVPEHLRALVESPQDARSSRNA